jgi:hypothetical protein
MRHTLSIFTGAALAALLFLSPVHAEDCVNWLDGSGSLFWSSGIQYSSISHSDFRVYLTERIANHPATYRWNSTATFESIYPPSPDRDTEAGCNAWALSNLPTNVSNNRLRVQNAPCTGGTIFQVPTAVRYVTKDSTVTYCESPTNAPPPDPSTVDTDGDGWPDIIDPFPNSGEPFDFWLSHWVTDSSGNVIWAIMVSEDSNGTQVANEVGNVDAYRDCLMNQCQEYGGHIYYDLNGNLRYRSDQDKIYTGEGNIGILPLNDPLHGGYSPTPLTAPSPGAFSPAPPTETSFDSGTQPTLSDSDSELLHKIASNTAGTTANIGELSKLLSDISGGIAGSLATSGSHTDLLKKIAENTGKSTGGSGGSGGTSITGDVSVQTSATEQEATQDALDTASDFGEDPIFDDTVDEWLPEAEDWGSMMTGFLNTNPVSAWLSGTHIETSSATCVISGTISTGGQSWTLKFDFCQWDYIFELMGTVFLSLSYLIGIMMVCRR